MSSTRLRDLLKPIVHVQEISKWRLNDSDLPPCVCSYLRLHYDHRSWVTWTHRLWVFLRISTTWVDTGTPSFQTVVIHQQQSAKKKKGPIHFQWNKNELWLLLSSFYLNVTFLQRNMTAVYLRVCGHGCGLHVRLVCGLGRDAQR